jgi:hypothetical protein
VRGDVVIFAYFAYFSGRAKRGLMRVPQATVFAERSEVYVPIVTQKRLPCAFFNCRSLTSAVVR